MLLDNTPTSLPTLAEPVAKSPAANTAAPKLCAARALFDAGKVQDATLLYSATDLRNRLGEFLSGFPGHVSYAVKANGGDEIITGLVSGGLSIFDVASLPEIRSVRAAAPHAVLHYHNPVKSRAEIAEAYCAYGVRRFAVDDMAELEKIHGVVGADPAVSIAVRFRLAARSRAAYDFAVKFGATPQEAKGILQRVTELGYVPVIAFHPGSQCGDPGAYRTHLLAAGKLARSSGVRPVRVNVGGGFPADYSGGRTYMPSLTAFFDTIGKAARDAFGADTPELECEPGRALVASCQSLLVPVKLVKPQRDEVFLAAGIYGGLMEVYQAPELMPPYRVLLAGNRAAEHVREMTVFGPTCDPLDRMPGMLDLPGNIGEGDVIEFGMLGAYAASVTTRFNGYGALPVTPVDAVFG
jgi:ornithine decarboxylase